MARIRIKSHSASRKLRDARRIAEPITMVERPLRFLRGGQVGRKGTIRRASAGDMLLAYIAVESGNGAALQAIARRTYQAAL